VRDLLLFVFILALYLVALSPVAACDLRAGVSTVEITPLPGSPLTLLGRTKSAEKVRDPLYARVVLLKTPNSSLAFVCSDLYRLHSPKLAESLRVQLGIDHVFLTATHSRSAPSLDPNSRESVWAQEVERGIVRAARQASENLFAAEIRWGQGGLLGAHNVRIGGGHGGVTNRLSNPGEEATAPYDPTVTVLRIDEPGKGLRALLVHYSCQPAILGPDNRQISADYPGALARFISAEMGPQVTCMFLPGASADVYPFRSLLSSPEGVEEVERMGKRLGREVARVANSVQSSPAPDCEILLTQEVLSRPRHGKDDRAISLGVGALLIGKKIGLLLVPGEMFVELQIALSAKAPVPMALVVGSTFSSGADWAGTLPTIAAAAAGGLGAWNEIEMELGTGEAIIDYGVIQMSRLLGKLSDLPKGELVRPIPDNSSP
jgi:hypothetical protein